MRKLLASLLLLIVFSVFIFFGGAVLKIFGSLDGPGVIEGACLTCCPVGAGPSGGTSLAPGAGARKVLLLLPFPLFSC